MNRHCILHISAITALALSHNKKSAGSGTTSDDYGSKSQCCESYWPGSASAARPERGILTGTPCETPCVSAMDAATSDRRRPSDTRTPRRRALDSLSLKMGARSPARSWPWPRMTSLEWLMLSHPVSAETWGLDLDAAGGSKQGGR
jgi:hypothetical protein